MLLLAAVVIGEIELLSSCKSTKIIQGLDLREIKLIVIASRIRFGMIFCRYSVVNELAKEIDGKANASNSGAISFTSFISR